jgi:hypothetical protein
MPATPFPALPKATQRDLYRLMQEMTLAELLLLMRLHHGLAWQGDEADLFTPDLVELLVVQGLVLRSHPAQQLRLTPAGQFLALLVAINWPGRPRPAGGNLPPTPPAQPPRPRLKLVNAPR